MSSQLEQDYRPGLEGVVACKTALARVDKDGGRLLYRGYDAAELALRFSFEEVVYLLGKGSLPSSIQSLAFKQDLVSGGRLDPETLNFLAEKSSARGVQGYRDGILKLGEYRSLKPWFGRDPQEAVEEALSLVASIPALLALQEKVDPGSISDELPYAHRLLAIMTGREPGEDEVKAFNAYLILVLEHGLNVSTLAVRAAASSGTDPASVLSNGFGAFLGPLHGGAPEPVSIMLDRIGSAGLARSWIERSLDSGNRIMGFGHRVYRVKDPRAMRLREICIAIGGARVELALKVEEEVLRALRERKPDRELPTNVEYWAAVLFNLLGLRLEQLCMCFGSSRPFTWVYHLEEQISDNKLYRPTSIYTGPDYIPLV